VFSTRHHLSPDKLVPKLSRAPPFPVLMGGGSRKGLKILQSADYPGPSAPEV